VSSIACSSHAMLHAFVVITSKARCRAVSLLSIFGVVTFAHGTMSCHAARLLLQSHSPANMQNIQVSLVKAPHCHCQPDASLQHATRVVGHVELITFPHCPTIITYTLYRHHIHAVQTSHTRSTDITHMLYRHHIHALQTSHTCSGQAADCRPQLILCCCRFANIQKEKRELQDRLVDYALQAMDTSTDDAFAESAGAGLQGSSARSPAGVNKQLQKSQDAEAVIAEVKLVTIQRLNVNVDVCVNACVHARVCECEQRGQL